MKLPLNLCFKGARTYIQGPDMLNAAIAAAAHQMGAVELRQLNFIVNRMTSHSLSMELEQGEQRRAVSETQSSVATMSFEVAGMLWHGTLVEDSNVPTCSYPYDEGSIAALCRTNQTARSITLEGESSFTTIEVIVAMTKALHQTLYPDAPGKWVFSRWDSEHWPITIPACGLSVALVKTLGSRLTKSSVICGGEHIGWVYFSAKVNS